VLEKMNNTMWIALAGAAVYFLFIRKPAKAPARGNGSNDVPPQILDLVSSTPFDITIEDPELQKRAGVVTS
jgi:hypothetical protein